jgi:hypothetical protein
MPTRIAAARIKAKNPLLIFAPSCHQIIEVGKIFRMMMMAMWLDAISHY